MRLNLTENNRPERMIASVLNADTSGTQNADNHISIGTPLVLNLTSTPQPSAGADAFGPGYQDGLQVVLPSTAGANPSQQLMYGIAMANIASLTLGESMIHGVCKAVIEVVLTRSATTTVWASYASINSGFVMSIDTVNNALATYTSLAAAQAQPPFVLLDSVASFTTNASTIGVSSLTSYASTILARVFVRQM